MGGDVLLVVPVVGVVVDGAVVPVGLVVELSSDVVVVVACSALDVVDAPWLDGDKLEPQAVSVSATIQPPITADALFARGIDKGSLPISGPEAKATRLAILATMSPRMGRTDGESGRGTWFAESAWLPEGLARDVSIECSGGRFTSVVAGTSPLPGAIRLPGIVFAGFANVHSHAFHRALRGRTHRRGSFWTWRRIMYELAGRIDPDRYLALARATYAEMAAAGITTVGEFHYLHHDESGTPYSDPNAMSKALIEAASDAGIRVTLLDACYLAGDLAGEGHLPPEGVQLRFADPGVESWARRLSEIPPGRHLVVGAAAHSVRAVPAAALREVATFGTGRPLHVHVSEQPGENAVCKSFYRATPAQLLADSGMLGPSTTAVHATHLEPTDVDLLADSGSAVCFCPTTERDLADGIGPARLLADRGVPLCIGTDQHVAIDMLGEAQALEMDERLASGERARFDMPDLVATLTVNGHKSLGWEDAGELRAGWRADLVALRVDTARTAGTSPEQVVVAAASPDVDTVVVDGKVVVSGGNHALGDIGELLTASIAPLWDEQ